MSLRFRKTFTLFPGVRLNISKSGISASIGVPGATVNFGQRGVKATFGLPGSGLSYSTSTIPYETKPSIIEEPDIASQKHLFDIPQSFDDNIPSNAKIYMPQCGMNEISSASVEVLTSNSLLPLRDLIAKAREQ